MLGSNVKFGSFQTQLVPLTSKLDKNKHKAYCLVDTQNIGTDKENEFFQFGAIEEGDTSKRRNVELEKEI